MCYSAEASFIASGALTLSSLAIARVPKQKASLPLSYIPAIFAAHQFSEGLIWLKNGNLRPGAVDSAPVLFYVVIAYVFWPVFIPLVNYLIEPDKNRRILIMLCQFIGMVVGLSYLFGIIDTPIRVSVSACNLSYSVHSFWNLGPAYLVAVSIPFLVSSHKRLRLFGALVVLSFAAGLYVASQPGFPSVWCFFAALMSISLYAYFRAEQRVFVSQAVDRVHVRG